MEIENQEDKAYAFSISIGTLILANELSGLEKDEERKEKKEKVVARKFQLLQEAFADETAGLEHVNQLYSRLIGLYSGDKAITFLIDLAFAAPFAPYELASRKRDFKKVMGKAGILVGVPGEAVENILETKEDALTAHRNIQWSKVAGYGALGFAVVATGGFLVAPAIGTALGAAAGLSGAAATAHGLAILGGGSLALGGTGMAGGLWLVTGVGAAVGLGIGGGSTVLLQLGAAGAKAELTKLQVCYKEVIIGDQLQLRKAQETIRKLMENKEGIEQILEEERSLNDKNAQRLKDLEEIFQALGNAIDWMEEKRKT